VAMALERAHQNALFERKSPSHDEMNAVKNMIELKIDYPKNKKGGKKKKKKKKKNAAQILLTNDMNTWVFFIVCSFPGLLLTFSLCTLLFLFS
jgi:hypothetical protein